ncbi:MULTISPECIES: hypothetical protein [unclassified Micromonospora]|uniref:hypothetical protein n=1 Tax=unclassified Micromonospora TaxID=2617518 RepID=UPI00331F2D32
MISCRRPGPADGGTELITSGVALSGGAVVGYVCCLVVLGLATGFAASSAGSGWPATVGTVATAAAMTATGPGLRRYLRRVMTTRPIGRGR